MLVDGCDQLYVQKSTVERGNWDEMVVCEKGRRSMRTKVEMKNDNDRNERQRGCLVGE